MGLVVSWISRLLVLVVFVDMIMRNRFKTSFILAQEMERHLLVPIFPAGAGSPSPHNGHARVYRTDQWVNLNRALASMIKIVAQPSPGLMKCGRKSYDLSTNH